MAGQLGTGFKRLNPPGWGVCAVARGHVSEAHCFGDYFETESS